MFFRNNNQQHLYHTPRIGPKINIVYAMHCMDILKASSLVLCPVTLLIFFLNKFEFNSEIEFDSIAGSKISSSASSFSTISNCSALLQQTLASIIIIRASVFDIVFPKITLIFFLQYTTVNNFITHW